MGSNPFAGDSPGSESPLLARREPAEHDTEPEALIRQAERILSRQDILGWKRLLRRTRQNVSPLLIEWRAKLGPEARNEEAWLAAFDDGVRIAEPLFVLAMTAIESEIPSISDQTGLIDDLLHLEGWDSGGQHVVVHVPAALAFLYHHVVGAMLLESSLHASALKLLTRRVRERNSTETHALWQDHELMGWVESLGGSHIVSWQHIKSFWCSRKWMPVFFRSERSFFDSYRAYATMASAIELATLLGDGAAPEQVNEELRLEVPPMFVHPGDEKGTDINDIVRLAIPSLEVFSEITKAGGCDITSFRAAWPSWFRQWLRFLSEPYRIFAYRLSQGDPPPLPE